MPDSARSNACGLGKENLRKSAHICELELHRVKRISDADICLHPHSDAMDMSRYKHRRFGLPAGLVFADVERWFADFFLVNHF